VKKKAKFDNQYDDDMAAKVLRLEANKRAITADRPEWDNASAWCGCRLTNSRRKGLGSALLLIDIQNDYFTEGKMEIIGSIQAGMSIPHYWDMLAPISADNQLQVKTGQ
jgi:hypothetical protein